MTVYTEKLNFKTKGELDIVDITYDVEKVVKDSKIKNGIAVVFVPGATGAVTTIEYEPNLLKDFKDALERWAPKEIPYRHPINGRSHVRASLIGPSLSVPIIDGTLYLGTWQQIVFLELDTRPRSRTLIVQVIGE
ncbi:MAG: secondary thiamine-phosphate synthase enzyme YjbQ [Candidatus Asgardarchaeia archaeon]